MSMASAITRPQMQALGLVGAAHFMSHFYGMVLPPLYPFLHDDLGVSYTALGALMSMKQVIAGGLQLPAGMAVDRYGAKNMLFFGLLACSIAFGVVGIFGTFAVLTAMMIVYAVGNSVFHPADYSILNGTMSDEFMGRSFSLHTFFGELGTAIAPSLLLAIAAIWGWQMSLLSSSVLGLIILVGLALQWQSMKDDAVGKPKKRKKSKAEEAAGASGEPQDAMSNWQIIRYVFTSPAILYLFLFFCVSQLASGGLRTFSVAGLVQLHDTPVAAAGTALTFFLFTGVFGILVGGYLADKTSRHDLIGALAMLVSAAVCLVVGSVDLDYIAIVFAFSIAGITQGMVRPSRDMMIRTAAPKGATGQVFGFVFSGQSFGGGVAPLVFGIMLDVGHPSWIFYTSAVFLVLCGAVMMMSARAARLQAELAKQAAE